MWLFLHCWWGWEAAVYCHWRCYREVHRGRSIVGRTTTEIGVLIVWAREVGEVGLLCFVVNTEGGPWLFVCLVALFGRLYRR